MMPLWRYIFLLLLLLGAQISAMERMKMALEDVDLAAFFLWTCVASVIAGLPLTL
jgi:hypothetical protein